MVSDDAVVHNALALRQAIETIEEEGIIPEDHGLMEQLRFNFQVMKEEIEQRGYEVPEEKGQGDFLQGWSTPQSPESAAVSEA